MRRRASSGPSPPRAPVAARAPWRPTLFNLLPLLLAVFIALPALLFARKAIIARASLEREVTSLAALASEAKAEVIASAEREAAAKAEAIASSEREAAAEARAASPDNGRSVANRAFLAAEAWRQEQVNIHYANMTDTDWDTAARWKSFALPDAPERTCGVAVLPAQLLEDIALLRAAVNAQPQAALANRSRGAYLALHAFHSTGLEGNTLTLPETLLTIAGQPLFAGYDARVQPSRAADLSATEALNVAQLWDALNLASLPAPPSLDLAHLNVTTLVDLNSAITRGTGAPPGLRLRPVAIGHKHVLLPMPDEVPVLVQEFITWLAASLDAEMRRAVPSPTEDGDTSTGDDATAALPRILALACDAHTRYVFVHPFADGNGRLARTLSALVLQRFALPGPMVPRSQRTEYMAAVSAATIDRDYAPLALIHAAAVRRSLGCLVVLARGTFAGVHPDIAVAAALARADCALDAALPAAVASA